jgi:hypothetical protein
MFGFQPPKMQVLVDQLATTVVEHALLHAATNWS